METKDFANRVFVWMLVVSTGMLFIYVNWRNKLYRSAKQKT